MSGKNKPVWEINPNFIIGVGGTGHLFLSHFKELVRMKYLENRNDSFPLIQYQVFDTEFISIPYKGKSLTEKEKKQMREHYRESDRGYETAMESCVELSEQCEIKVIPEDLSKYLTNPSLLGIDDFMPTNVSSIKPGTFGASQIGLIALVAGIANFSKIYKKLEEQIKYLVGSKVENDLNTHWSPGFKKSGNGSLTIYIVCSTGGGTGRGLFMLLGMMCRDIMKNINPDLANTGKIILVNFTPDCFTVRGRVVPVETYNPMKAQQYGAFKELDSIMSNYDRGASGAVEIDNYFKLNRGYQEKKKLAPFDSVLMISSKLDGNGAEQLDSYKMLNSIAAESIASLIFSNYQGNLQAALCNVRDPMEEAKTKMLRQRKYGRLGRGALRYPVKRLVGYLKNYISYQCIMDLEDGRLVNIPEEPAEKIAGSLFERIKGDIDNRYPAPQTTTFDELGENSFENNYGSKLQRIFSQKINTLASNHDEQDKILFGETDKPGQVYLSQEIDNLKKLLIGQIEENGVTYARSVYGKLKSEINGFEAELRRKFMTGQELENESAIKIINDLINSEYEGISEYLDGKHPGFENAFAQIQNDRELWHKKRKFLQKLHVVRDDSKTVSGASKKSIDGLITNFQKCLRSLHQLRKVKTYLTFYEKFRVEIAKLDTAMNTFSRFLNRTDDYHRKLGVAEEYIVEMSKILTQSKNPTEIFIYGNNKEEYESFCKSFPKISEIYSIVHANLNEQTVSKLFDHGCTPESIRNALYDSISREVNRETQELNISSYFQKLYRDGENKYIRGLWESLYSRSSWLGHCSANRIGPKHRNESDFKEFGFLELANPHDFTLSGNNVAGLFGRSTQLIQRDYLDELIIWTRYQVEMPLFVFDSIYETINDYDRLARGEDDSEAAAAAMAKFHTSKQYFYVDEPLGKISHIPVSEKEETINFMLHIGGIEVDTEGYLLCYHRKEGSNYMTLKRWLLNEYDETTGVLFEEYCEDMSAYPELTIHLLNSTAEWLKQLADPQKGGVPLRQRTQKILKKYLEQDSYPTIPETYLENRLLKNNNAQMSKLFRQKEINANYKKKQVRFSKKFPTPALYRNVDIMNAEMELEPCEISMSLYSLKEQREGLNEEDMGPLKQNGNGDSKLNSKKPVFTSGIEDFIDNPVENITPGLIDEKIKGRLLQLKELFDEDLISSENYEQAKAKVLFSNEDISNEEG